MKQIVQIVIFCLSFQICWSQRELLTCIEAEAKLPQVSARHSSIYDGQDAIYTFGGYSDGYLNTIYKYSISQDTITLVQLIPEISRGILTMHNGSMLHIGGWNGERSKNIYKYSPESNRVEQVGQMLKVLMDGVALKYNDSSNIVQIVGNYWDYDSGLRCLNLSDLSSCGTTTLINKASEAFRGFVDKGFAYLFSLNFPFSQVERIDLLTLESELLPAEFPKLKHPPSVVFDGRFGYIIGGYLELDTGIPVNGIIRYDPETYNYEFIRVVNFPARSSEFYGYGTAVYVEKLHRIYMIGGSTSGADRNEIWYIDLNSTTTVSPTTEVPVFSTLNPDIFTCEENLNGIYPNPYNCDKFIICHNGATEHYNCPFPLLFSPVTLSCTFPEAVNCEISCIGKPNDMYPHPQACNLFIGCHNGVVEIYKCPEPLFFDPTIKQCNLPEEVECTLRF